MHYKDRISRTQIMMTSYDSMISPNNPVRLIDMVCRKFVEDNPKSINWKGSNNKGRKSYPASSMLSLLVYGYFHGITTSRKLEHHTLMNIEMIWLMEGLQPDHWTICEFRRNCGKLISSLLKTFRRFLLDQSYASMQKVVYDGSKMKAYANRNMLTVEKIQSKLEHIEKSITGYLSQLESNDHVEDDLEKANEEIAQLKSMIAKLEGEKSKLEEAEIILNEKDDKYLSPNDPDANLMKGRDGTFAGYNGQTGVETKGHFIMSNHITTDTNDTKQLTDNFENTINETGIVPKEVLADKGYGNTGQILDVEKSGETKCYIPLPETRRESSEKMNIVFNYSKENDCYTCHQGKKLIYQGKSKKKSGVVFNVYKCRECDGCVDREKCTTSKTGRILKRNVEQDKIDTYKTSLESEYSKEMVRQRKQFVEHPFGTIKLLMGKFNFLLKGLEKVGLEFDLYVMAYNLKRLISVTSNQNIMIKIKEYDWKIDLKQLFEYLKAIVKTGSKNNLTMITCSHTTITRMHYLKIKL